MSPEVPVAIAQVSVPPSAWPRLDFHVHRVPFHRFAERPQLLEQRRKRHFQRRLNMYFLCHAKRHLQASLQVTFATLLEQQGPFSETIDRTSTRLNSSH